MTETKWTNGPWFLDDLDAQGQRVVRQQDIEICTCWHHSVGSIEKEMEANAHLIAAAPTLYEAGEQSAIQLEEAANILEGNGLKAVASIFRMQVIKQRAALAKARGEAQ